MISGTGRSGTNITKAIFARHSKVATLPFEYRIMIDPGGIIDFYNSITTSWSPFASDKKIKDLEHFLLTKSSQSFGKKWLGKIIKYVDPSGLKTTPPPYHGWELEKWIPGYKNYVLQLIDQLKSFEYSGRWPGSEGFSRNNQLYFSDKYHTENLIPILRTFITNTTNSILSHQEREVFVEDNTWNILYARELLEILPQARLIHIVRDPRDVIASFMKQKWSPSNFGQALAFYKSIVERWDSAEKLLDPKFFHVVKFEELIAKPQKMIENMCDFAGLSFTKSMTDLDLSRGNIGRWKQTLNSEEIGRIKQELKDLGGIFASYY